MRGLKNATKNDIILISDIDEIPNLFNLKKSLKQNKFVFFKQRFFRYKLNLSIINSKEEKLIYKTKYREWIGTVASLKKDFISPQYLRDLRNRAEKYIFRKKKNFFLNNFFYLNHILLKMVDGTFLI